MSNAVGAMPTRTTPGGIGPIVYAALVAWFFLVLAAYGVLPLVFAVPAGAGDAVAAVGALIVGVALYSRRGAAREMIVGWNVFGMADLMVAVIAGTLSRSGGILHLAGSGSSEALGTFPLALVPEFIVPLYVITHLIVFIQIRRHWAGAPRVRMTT